MKRFVWLFGGVITIYLVALGGLIFFNYHSRFFVEMSTSLITNWLVLIIIGAIFLGILVTIQMFLNSWKESKILEKIISENSQDIIEGRVKPWIHQSLILKHLQKISTAQTFHWNKATENALKEYLEDVLFFWTKKIDFLASSLPGLGMLGTVMGMSEALFSKSQGKDMYWGIAVALGTTILGLIGNLVVSSLNEIIKSEREAQLKTISVIVSLGFQEVQNE
jgi:flagellar motor component MotA